MDRDLPQYGVLLPHFGPYATRDRLIEGSKQIEAYGFDSVWVRDHLVFHPHLHELQDRTHVEPFVVLSAMAAVTQRLKLGMAVLIPHRHPIHTALLLGSLEYIAGPGRVIAGVGIGPNNHEFESIGRGDEDRKEVLPEQVAIMRKLWSGDSVTHSGRYYQFEDVTLKPVPAAHNLPIFYGGASVASVRRAVEYCDGWMPGRIPRFGFRKRVERLHRMAGEAGKPSPVIGVVPYFSPATTVEAGRAAVDVPSLGEELAADFPGEYASWNDLDDAAIAGPAEVLVEGVRKFQEDGAEHLVFDMRRRFADWEECLQMLGEEVLPALHKGDGR